MKRAIAIILLSVVLTQGCAQLQHAVEVTPQRMEAAWTDPVRRTHIIGQAALSGSSAAVAVACGLAIATIVAIPVCAIVGGVYYYLTYEYVLEPWSKARVKEGKPSIVGPYWERGPQDGEEFKNE
mgnify:CR=1 FL=1